MMRSSCDRGVYNLHIGQRDTGWQFCAVLDNIRPILTALVVFQMNVSGYKMKACYAAGLRLGEPRGKSTTVASTAICGSSLWVLRKVFSDWRLMLHARLSQLDLRRLYTYMLLQTRLQKGEMLGELQQPHTPNWVKYIMGYYCHNVIWWCQDVIQHIAGHY